MKEPLKYGWERHKELYVDDEVDHYTRSKTVARFLRDKAKGSKNTLANYRSRLAGFAQYIFQTKEQMEVDAFIEQLMEGEYNPYEILADYVMFLRDLRVGPYRMSANTMINMTVLAKKFLRFCGLPINNEDFKERVLLPKKEKIETKALEKKDVVEILNSCRDVKLKTIVMFLAVTGAKAIEAMSIRLSDLDLNAKVPAVSLGSSRSKRKRFLTKELAGQLKLWLGIKYEPHRTTLKKDDGKGFVQKFVEPQPKREDLVFSVWHPDGSNPTAKGLYDGARKDFARLLDIANRAKRESSGRRRAITLHSFRRFVWATVAGAGYGDYGEWWLGHKKSSYHKKSQTERMETFKRVEPFLTFLDMTALEAKGIDFRTKIEESDREVRELRQELHNLYQLLHNQGILAKQGDVKAQ